MSLRDQWRQNHSSPLSESPSLFQHFARDLPRLRQQLIGHPDQGLKLVKHPQQRGELEAQVAAAWQQQHSHPLSSVEKTWLVNELFGLGPLQPLVEGEGSNEIMVNGPGTVYVERQGIIEKTPIHFNDEAQLRETIEKIARFVGRTIDQRCPMMDARLPDGSRVNAVIPPLSLHGATLTIRRFRKQPMTLANQVDLGLLTEAQSKFLDLCVKARLNILISGGTGSGKTTLLNALSFCIPDNERIITIEDAAELQINKQHVICLEARPASLSGDPSISIRDLVRNALRMRPDRIVVGEVRGEEALDMLQAMNTGHDGSLTTGHANSPRDMLARIETMVLFAGYDLPVLAIRKQVASALDLVIHVARRRDGRRVIESIVEVVGMEGDTLTTAELFRWQGDALLGLGLRPVFSKRIEEQGFMLSPDLLS